jgi:intracellular sulfur oxidation DsrE/DsrF family protein
MNRRGILATMLAAVGTPLAAAGTVTRAAAGERDVPKVAYHLDDFDKVSFVLGNIEHHFDGMGGPDKLEIALVVHGPALKGFHAASAGADAARRLDQLVKAGLQLHACANTMKAQHVGLQDLLPGFAAAERGGVVLLAEMQSRGFAYLRP